MLRPRGYRAELRFWRRKQPKTACHKWAIQFGSGAKPWTQKEDEFKIVVPPGNEKRAHKKSAPFFSHADVDSRELLMPVEQSDWRQFFAFSVQLIHWHADQRNKTQNNEHSSRGRGRRRHVVLLLRASLLSVLTNSDSSNNNQQQRPKTQFNESRQDLSQSDFRPRARARQINEPLNSIHVAHLSVRRLVGSFVLVIRRRRRRKLTIAASCRTRGGLHFYMAQPVTPTLSRCVFV